MAKIIITKKENIKDQNGIIKLNEVKSTIYSYSSCTIYSYSSCITNVIPTLNHTSKSYTKHYSSYLYGE